MLFMFLYRGYTVFTVYSHLKSQSLQGQIGLVLFWVEIVFSESNLNVEMEACLFHVSYFRLFTSLL